MSVKSGSHVTKLPEVDSSTAQSQQLAAAAHAYYVLTSHAQHAVRLAAAAAAHAHTQRRLFNGQRPDFQSNVINAAVYCVSKKNDTNMACYNSDIH